MSPLPTGPSGLTEQQRQPGFGAVLLPSSPCFDFLYGSFFPPHCGGQRLTRVGEGEAADSAHQQTRAAANNFNAKALVYSVDRKPGVPGTHMAQKITDR